MSNRSLALTVIDGRTYTGATATARRRMLPSEAGVYVWTLQLGKVLEGLSGPEEFPGGIRKAFSVVRDGRQDAGRAGLFRRVHIYDDPPDLTARSVERLAALLPGGQEQFAWMLTLGTVFQRPLYVGKAIDFRQRLPSHFGYRTAFARALRELRIGFEDCAVTLLRLTDDAFEQLDDSDAAGLEDAQDAAEALAGALAADAADDEDEEVETVPPGREDQDRLIRLAESLLIRNLQPIMNRRVE